MPKDRISAGAGRLAAGLLVAANLVAPGGPQVREANAAGPAPDQAQDFVAYKSPQAPPYNLRSTGPDGDHFAIYLGRETGTRPSGVAELTVPRSKAGEDTKIRIDGYNMVGGQKVWVAGTGTAHHDPQTHRITGIDNTNISFADETKRPITNLVGVAPTLAQTIADGMTALDNARYGRQPAPAAGAGQKTPAGSSGPETRGVIQGRGDLPGSGGALPGTASGYVPPMLRGTGPGSGGPGRPEQSSPSGAVVTPKNNKASMPRPQ